MPMPRCKVTPAVFPAAFVLERTESCRHFWVPEPLQNGFQTGNVRHAIGHGLIYSMTMSIIGRLFSTPTEAAHIVEYELGTKEAHSAKHATSTSLNNIPSADLKELIAVYLRRTGGHTLPRTPVGLSLHRSMTQYEQTWRVLTL